MKRKAIRTKKKSMSVPTAVLLGIGIALIAILLEAVLGACLLERERVTQEQFPMYVPVLLFAANFAGVGFSLRRCDEQKMLVNGLTCLGFWLVLLAIPALYFDGCYGRVGICALGIILGGMAALWVNTRSGRKKYR